MTDPIKIVAVIPAHMASVRLKEKILMSIHGLPMIEHVRRRALLVKSIESVYVATCDQVIANVVKSHGGQVIMTSDRHMNGTSRVAEAVTQLDCTHVMVLQGDEPLMLPDHLNHMVEAIHAAPLVKAWNATAPIKEASELDQHSFVKCILNETQRILFCCRRSPCYASFDKQVNFVRKILGMIAFEKDFLLMFSALSRGQVESAESIEQMRVIEHGVEMRSVPVGISLPSVNEPGDMDVIVRELASSPVQRKLLDLIIDEPILSH